MSTPTEDFETITPPIPNETTREIKRKWDLERAERDARPTRELRPVSLKTMNRAGGGAP